MVNPDFSLHPRLAADCHEVCQIGRVMVLLLDDARYPWLVLVPTYRDVVEWVDLPASAQNELHQLTMLCSHILRALFAPDKINIGALGNLVPPLHVHVLARFKHDPAWPGPVWGHSKAVPYSAKALAQRLESLKEALA